MERDETDANRRDEPGEEDDPACGRHRRTDNHQQRRGRGDEDQESARDADDHVEVSGF